jgi:hypothetical protein
MAVIGPAAPLTIWPSAELQKHVLQAAHCAGVGSKKLQRFDGVDGAAAAVVVGPIPAAAVLAPGKAGWPQAIGVIAKLAIMPNQVILRRFIESLPFSYSRKLVRKYRCFLKEVLYRVFRLCYRCRLCRL